MDISYEKFIGALQSIHDATLSGDDMVAKFSYAVDKLMPADLMKGRYKMLGGLLQSLGKEFVPLTGSDYFSKSVDLRRLEQGIRDVLETVDYVLKKMASGEEGMEEVVRETLLTLSPRIDKMRKMKKKFSFIALRPMLKKQVLKAASLPGEIDECLGKTEDDTVHISDLERDLKNAIVGKDDALLSILYRTFPEPSENLDAHREHTGTEKILKSYLRVLRLVIRKSREAGYANLEGLSEDAKGVLEDGSITEELWQSFASRKKNDDVLKKNLEDLILNYSVPRRVRSQKEKFAEEYSLFSICDWIEWSLSMSVGLPMMLTARKSLTLYRNLVVDMLGQRSDLLEELKSLECYSEDLEKDWLLMDEKMTASVRTVKVQAFLPKFKEHGADLEKVLPMGDKLRMIHQLLMIMEQEMVRVSTNIDRQLTIARQPRGVTVDDLGSTASQMETLVNCGQLGVKAGALSPHEYSPMAYQWTVRVSEEEIIRQIKKLFKLFPKFEFPLQNFSFKKPLTYKVKDFTNDFTPQNFASRIRDLRQEFTENSDPYKKLKLLFVPGVGSGCYDENSMTLIVPGFRKDTDHDCLNFLMALADYVTITRGALSDVDYEKLFEKLKRLRSLPPQMTSRHRKHILAWSIRELLRLNEQRDAHIQLKEILVKAFESSPEVVADGDLDDAIMELMEFHKK